MTIDAALIETLLHMPESSTLDFKEAQYPFSGASDDAKYEVVKDILAFANAWKTSDAFIVIGAKDQHGQRATVTGIADQLDDASVQQFVNTKTNVPIDFEYVPTVADGKPVAIIRIAREQARPVYLKKRCGPLSPNVVYIRRGSSTAEASPEEIAQMGVARVSLADEPQLVLCLGDPDARSELTSPIELVPLRASEDPNRAALRDLIEKTSLRAIFKPLNIVGQPSEEDNLSARRDAALFTKLAFKVKNSGRVLLRDVRIVASIPALDGLRIVAEKPRTKGKATFGFADLEIPRTPMLYDTTVDQRAGVFELDARVQKIQPQATAWTDAFWIGAGVACAFSASVKVFADNLSAPVETSFDFEIRPRDVFDNDLPPAEE